MQNPLIVSWFTAAAAMLVFIGCSTDKTYPVHTYNMGERVDLGHIVYVAFETQWLTQIGTGPEAKIPQNRFFLVRMSATNGLGSEIMVPAVTLEDDSGNRYQELSADVGAPQWMGVLRSVRSAESAQGNVVFDAPPRHYKMRVMDETGERIAYIDIPLSFGAETPEIGAPGAANQPFLPPSPPATAKKR